MGGDVNGWLSCTESLGFESSDERLVDGERDDIQMSSTSHLGYDYDQEFYCWRRSTNGEASSRWRKVGDERREAKKFPPPFSSLNIHGQPSFFLLPERKDGRLKLKEVRVQRPEILRASRQDGRLRLHLIRDLQEEDEEVEDETGVEEKQELTEVRENVQEEELEEEENEKRQGVGVEVEEGRGEGEELVVVGEISEEEEREGERKTGRDWMFPVSGGEGLTKFHELVNHHPHHSSRHHPCHSTHHRLHVWRQHCVTT